MFELLVNFQRATEQFNPIFLVVPGIAAVIAGFFIWLGGLGLTKLLAGITGAITGVFCGLFIVGRNLPAALFMAAVLAAFAIIFHRVFTTVLTAGLCAAVTFTVLAWPYLGNPRLLSEAATSTESSRPPTFTPRETTEAVKAYMVNFSRQLKQVCSRMPKHLWVIFAALTVISFFIALWSWRLAAGLSYSVLGTILVLAGMISLLLYKGSNPISVIFRKGLFYGGAFVAMIAFGTIVQLLLCWRAPIQKKKKQTAKDDQESQDEKQSWRST